MADERSISEEGMDAAKRRQVVSFRRLEHKVDVLTARVDSLNLNGSTAALLKLAACADQLTKLAEVAPQLVEAVERDVEWAIARKVFLRILNPLRPLGAFIWLVTSSAVAAVIWNAVTTGHPF